MKKIRYYRKILVVCMDIALTAISFFLAFYLRFDGRVPAEHMVGYYTWMPVLVGIRLGFFLFFDLYGGMWRYASINDLLAIIKAAGSGSMVFVLVIVFFHGLVGFPRSVFITELVFTIVLLGASRFALRVHREVFPKKSMLAEKKLLIIGAGDAGYMLLREIKNNPALNYRVVGFIDDEKLKQSMNIQGVPILGTRHDIARVVELMEVDEIIIAIPSATRYQLRPIVEECEKARVRVKTTPAIGDLINGKITFSQVREVQIEDLLGREVVRIDKDIIGKYIAGKRVMVTGAGGSIGSAICRKVMKFAPKSLVLFGRGEFSIYEINNELSSVKGETELAQVIGGATDKRRLDAILEKYRPQIIFHAGADKHVPLLELNPGEAILNNVIGTKCLIESAEEHGVEKVVCISTDKAADPVSVMGCAKRIVEMIIQGRKSETTTTIGVRFGNVLGSRGSVIPLFRRQIARGGPVTVTHPEMVRYFMTIPEAAGLVLQAGAMGKCGDLFLLDMGNPVNIHDLARQMILLSGLEPDKDIPIEFTGLRPGEKLVESLTGANEALCHSDHAKIFLIKFHGEQPGLSRQHIEELAAMAMESDSDSIRRKLKEIVPNYQPWTQN
ncbi:MAG: hypothetical protein A2219_03445 [Elusimicrobia bacterium RIFOXYA2_FULL_50_26]|nr:MAG: hypothetical protein A2219_03445 [Elusimicrobia bacterium RIFOXYA2_FULL_50_26]OGS25351.1 MAG: hypothetical protein A2314_06435 [Elusimicrobia bacterium RIFOXYB2_FULL_50_12]